MYQYETLELQNYTERIKMAISLLVERSIINSGTDFWKSLGFTNSSRSSYFSKKGSPILKYRVALSIAYEYPILSAEWLVAGKGPILKPGIATLSEEDLQGRVDALESQVSDLKKNLVKVLEYMVDTQG